MNVIGITYSGRIIYLFAQPWKFPVTDIIIIRHHTWIVAGAIPMLGGEESGTLTRIQ